MAWGEAHQVDYVLGLAKNELLKAQPAEERDQAAEPYRQTGRAASLGAEPGPERFSTTPPRVSEGPVSSLRPASSLESPRHLPGTASLAPCLSPLKYTYRPPPHTRGEKAGLAANVTCRLEGNLGRKSNLHPPKVRSLHVEPDPRAAQVRAG